MPGKIPKQFIDDLLSRIDIVDVIDARVPLKKAGKDYKACCPFHEEKTPSFTVSQDKQFYHCFGCGVNGSAIKFLMDYEHMSFPEAVKDLAQRAGLTVPQDAHYSEDSPDITAPLLEVLGQADRFYRRMLREHPQAHEAIDYLKRRGLSGEIAADFGLGFAPDGWDNLLKAAGTTEDARAALLAAGLLVKKDGGGYYDRFRHRVMFPIQDHRGRLIGFGGRVLDQGEPKYLNSPETPLFHKGRELYGLYRARDALKRTGRALVVEGYMDVVALAQYGLDFAVATLGTATTRDHLERLFRYVPEVVFCFDGDRAGREAAWRALENGLPVLHEGRQVSFLFLPEGEDPDTLVRKEGAAEFGARLKAASPLPDYFFQHLADQVDLSRLDGRARLVELARPHLSKMRSGVLRQLMVSRLADLCHLPAADLGRLLESGERPATPSTQRDARRPAGGQTRPSLVRTAITLLLQHPALARTVVDVDGGLRALLGRPGVALLFDLIQLLKDRPDVKTGFIIEHYRDSEYQHALTKLLTWEHPTLSGDIETEFQGVLEQLRREALRAETERLMDKDRLSGLTAAEKVELKRLLAEKSGGQPV